MKSIITTTVKCCGWLFVLALTLAMTSQVTASIIASDNFDAETSYKTLAGQGSPGYGWYSGWVDNPGATLNVYVTNSLGTGDMDYTPVGGTLIPGGTNSVDTATGGGTGMPIVARQLFTPQTGTFYAACAMRFQVGAVNTGDAFGFCLNNDPVSMAYGVQVGYYGDPGGSPNNSLLYLQTGVAAMLSTPSNSRNGVHYLVVKVEKTGTGNYDKVTLWADPAANSETTNPNGDVQLAGDLGISSISQISLFGQNLDSGDRCRFDSLALATTFADLMAPAGPGPAGAAPVSTIRVEAAADGSANAALPAQNLPLLNNTLTCYAIARNASGVFLSNTPASWFLTNITGSVVAGDLAPSADGKSAVLTSHMAGSAKILAVGSATNLVTSGVITVPAGIDQFDALRLYWWTNLMAGSPSPSTVASTAQGYWNTMNTNAGRTNLWSGIPYGSPNSYNIVSTFIRLSAMAQAWAMPGCSLQGNTNLAAAVASGMDWMVANVYTTTATEYGNWFHWEDSGPQNFESAIVFLYPALTSTEINNYCAAIDHFNPSGWMTGANTADKIQIMAIRGILGKNASKMVTARDETSTLFPFVTNGDGFYTDGSFLFHTVAVGSSYGAGFAYTGGYGVDLLSKIPTIVNLLQPSQWQITDPALTNVLFWVTAGDEPLLYNGNMMDMVRGRNIAVDSETESSTGGDVLTAIQQIAAFAPTATGAAFTNFVNSPRLTSGQFNFANMDRVVAQRGNFAFGISMSSTRVAMYESINNENLHGWFTGDGMTYLYVGSGETQFSGDFWPSVDPYFLPGTTVETTVLTNAAGGYHQTTDQNWVGGAQVADTYGVAGMSLHPNCTNTTLYAKKSWFMLDNEMVCLGAGITCGDPAGVHTTAENRRLGSPITQSFTLNGKAITPTVGWSSNLPSATPSWCALSGTGGYYFPAGQTNLQATIVADSGAWSDIDQYTGPPTTVYTDNYLRLWYDHGAHPTNVNYSYVILPNMTATSVSNYALAPDIVIVTNTASIQAVKKPSLGLVAANFWTTGTNSADFITVNNKASVVAWQSASNFFVGIADPTQTNTRAITVTLNCSATGLVSADPGVTVVQLSPKIILSVNVNGAYGQAFQASFSGVLASSIYWNLPGSGSWAIATDWTPTTVPNATGVLASFGGGGTAITGPCSVTLDGSPTVGGINFSNSVYGFTLNLGTGGTLTLDNTPGTPLIADLAGSHTVAVPITLSSLGANVSVASASALAVNGVISGPGGLTSGGNGTLTLAAANTYNGTTLTFGTLVVTNSGTLGSTTGALNVNGGVLDLGGTSQTVGAVVVAGGAIQHGTLTVSSFTGQGGTVGANLSGLGTALTNLAGTLTLSGTNTYTGSTVVSGGTLQNGSASAFTGNSSLTMTGAATFDLNGFNAIFGNVTAGVNTATITDQSAGAGTTTLTITNDSGTIADVIQDGAAKKIAVVIRNNNSAATIFSLANNNTFSGGLTLASGYGTGTRLRVSALITGSPFGSGPITIGQAPTDKAGILLDTVANNTVTNSIVFNTALGTDVPGIRLDTGGHTFSGTITANQSPALFVGNAAGVSINLTGQITGTNGLSITANGAGAQTLAATLNNLTANANNYAGATVISNSRSTFILGQANQIPDGPGAGNVTNNGTLNLNGFNETINGLNGSGTVDGFSGTPTFTLGGNNAGGLFSGVITDTAGSLNLVKTGTGTQTLSGVNTYSGTTTIGAGTLALSGAGSIANSTNVSLAGGATFNILAGGFTVGSGQTLTGAGLVTGGPVTIANGGQFVPGAGLGSLTISNALTLSAGSTTWIELNKAANTNDSVRGLSSVSYNGTVQMTNLAGTLTNGDAFKLFYAGSFGGSFAALSPVTPAIGLRWNTNTLAADGTLRITNAPMPRIPQVTLRNGNLILSVTNGTAGMTTYVQTNTNLSNPSGWSRISTNMFDNSGGLLWSNQFKLGTPATFYRIEAP